MIKKYSKSLLFIIPLVFFGGCGSLTSVIGITSSPIKMLRDSLSQKFDDPQFDNAYWGVMVRSLKTGEVIYSRNEKKMFMPASNMKLFTTSSALSVLGQDFRYKTRLMATDSISNGELFGDIVFVGSGDPTITTKFNDSIPTKIFELWADSLKAKGIVHIDGNIIGDDNCFDDEYYGNGWSADDETDWYAAQISGITYNDNCVDITVTADTMTGVPCKISWLPNTKFISVINQTMTVPADSNEEIIFHRKRGTNTIVVKGFLPVGIKPWKESIAVDNPTLYALTVMKEVFELKGITVRGRVIDIDDLDSVKNYSSAVQVGEYISPTLDTLVKAVNKPSQNLYAEQIFRTIGIQSGGKGSVEFGKKGVYPVLSKWGVDTVRLRMVDGSGLSRQDLVTPYDICSILSGMASEPSFQAFYQSLPIAGVDGTIKNRMKGTKAEGNVHAKTGYIGYVRSLSGYVTDADGEMLIFSMIANNYTVPTRIAEKIQNDVCIELANFSRLK